MPTITPQQHQLEGLLEQITDHREQALSSVREVALRSVEQYEKAVDRAIELELELVGKTRQKWLQDLIDAQVGRTRDLTGSSADTLRKLIG